MRCFGLAFALFYFLLIPGMGKADEVMRLTSLAPNVLLARTSSVSVEIYDGVTDGCMKWPTGVLQSAQDGLSQAGLFVSESSRVLQIVANGYGEAGTNLCFVNIDLILDEVADVYFQEASEKYAALVRFDIWKTSFMISGDREDMQGEIQSRIGRAIEAFVSDINRSKEIVLEEDPEYYEKFILSQ
jgi:hypothetical protein